jgi:hypothetical protein
MKRGFLGPFNCLLCNNNQEDINHLLWDCPFAKSCWNLAYGDLARFIRWPSSPHPSLGNWDKYYRGSFKDKPVLKQVWWVLAKFLCWQIWKTRNRKNFQGKITPPQTVAAKEKLLLSEAICSRPMKIEDTTNWNGWEKDWMASFNLKTVKYPQTAPRSRWQLHHTFNMELWIQKQKTHTLCFDGASKGNPGEAGAGGDPL